jgi:hypothetical protein
MSSDRHKMSSGNHLVPDFARHRWKSIFRFAAYMIISPFLLIPCQPYETYRRRLSLRTTGNIYAVADFSTTICNL